ncbi:mRNA decay activator protein ZFP36L1-like [Engraulis encrasicolus]|uniref:mRNA decay activator protein ZFP36L1-like n=1 Tax=Engraulis encrasicolus TaxID=184585 RepID=UPI002FCF39B3
MPSDFLTPFLELDDEFCKNFRSLDMTDGLPAATTQKQRAVGFQRRHSLCPVTLPNSKFNINSGCFEGISSSGSGSGSSSSSSNSSSNINGESSSSSFWPLSVVHQQWNNQQQQLPRNSLNQIPFRVDRSVSMIEGHVGSGLGSSTEQPLLPPLPVSSTGLMPPPGLSISNNSLTLPTSPKSLTPTPTPPISTRYKTELCRTYEESGTCKYGAKCQFAHGMDELRGLNRHPKYKTEPCRTFHTIGFCPYGARCHFIHNADEILNNGAGAPPCATRQKLRERPQLMRQSVSFAGFSSQPLTGFQSLHEPLAFSRASSVSPPPSTGSPDLLSPLFPEPRSLKPSYPLPLPSDLDSDQLIATSRAFRLLAESKVPSSGFAPKAVSVVAQDNNNNNHHHHRNAFTLTGLSALQRSTSADSLSDQEGYTSSSSLSGSESPSLEGKRLPIFSRLSVSDD